MASNDNISQVPSVVDGTHNAPSSTTTGTQIQDTTTALVERIEARIRTLEERLAADRDNNSAVDTAVPTSSNKTCTAPAHSEAVGHARPSSASGSTAASGIVCPSCNSVVTFSQPEDRWYTVWCGHQVGWIKGHSRAMNLTLNVSGQGFRYSPTGEQGARALYHEKQLAGDVHVVDDPFFVNVVYNVDEGALFP
ncbi:hypothetical protein AAF712_010884 [Marasmius tenuissimus]|uniref:Uncharacterized protein n=1 Tax=Marasmius tenuissimus TaxID=585030 RepID=A0ABR2ZM27_9AGAR